MELTTYNQLNTRIHKTCYFTIVEPSRHVVFANNIDNLLVRQPSSNCRSIGAVVVVGCSTTCAISTPLKL